MRNLVFILMLGCSACSAPKAVETERYEANLTERVAREVQMADELRDYRLYAFSGRRITLPGLSQDDSEIAKVKCGTKFMPGSGDVLKTAAQRAERRAKFDFAARFNQLVYKLCLNQ